MLARTFQTGLRSFRTSSQVVPSSLRTVSFIPKACYSDLRPSETDAQLITCLDREIDHEKENQDSSTPEFLREFQKMKLFQIKDTPGENEVVLERTLGSEKISVTFSIDDVNNIEEDEHTNETIMPVSTVITIAKKNSDLGALTFQAVAEKGSFYITHITHTANPNLAMADDAESDYQRRGQYIGPAFDELEESLSNSFYEFLESRGVDYRLSDFITEYVQFKEQLEYQRWLENVRKFVAKDS